MERSKQSFNSDQGFAASGAGVPVGAADVQLTTDSMPNAPSGAAQIFLNRIVCAVIASPTKSQQSLPCAAA